MISPHTLSHWSREEPETPLDRTKVGRGNGSKFIDMGSRSYQPQGIGATRSDMERSKKKE